LAFQTDDAAQSVVGKAKNRKRLIIGINKDGEQNDRENWEISCVEKKGHHH
jgi:hypothetical protein